MSRKMIEVGVFFGMEWRSPSLIAFPRIRAYLRTAFYYFFPFLLFLPLHRSYPSSDASE